MLSMPVYFILTWKYNSQSFHRPKFRNYRPEQEALVDTALPDAEPGDVEAEVKEQLESAKTRGIIEELVSSSSPD